MHMILDTVLCRFVSFQAEYLADFYEFCKRLDLARNFQFPTLRQVLLLGLKRKENRFFVIVLVFIFNFVTRSFVPYIATIFISCYNGGVRERSATKWFCLKENGEVFDSFIGF